MSGIFLSLGSNLGDRGQNLQEALVALEKWGIKIIRTSSIYETEPIGNHDQPMFLNMVVQIETEKSPQDLLMIIHSIERANGRVRTSEQWGPRTLDIDLLLYGDEMLEQPDLKIPHPHLQERKFVLVPLNEIAPDFVHPVLKKTVRQLLESCDDTSRINLSF